MIASAIWPSPVIRFPNSDEVSYLGPRVGLYLSSSKSGGGSSSVETSETDLSIGLTIGSEYFMTPHLSFGGEAQLNYISFGDPETTYTPAPPFPVTTSDRTRSFIWSNVIFLFRWYFCRPRG